MNDNLDLGRPADSANHVARALMDQGGITADVRKKDNKILVRMELPNGKIIVVLLTVTATIVGLALYFSLPPEVSQFFFSLFG